jgi:DNA (cytosine-5)-methyltransferase 1
LTALGSQPNGISGLIHPDFDRKFTIPEQMRLNGMPRDFRFMSTTSHAAERMGLMVPPLLMKAVAQSVHDRVLRPYRDGDV